MATHFSILAWKIPQTEEPGVLWPMESRKNRTQLSDKQGYNIIDIIMVSKTLYHFQGLAPYVTPAFGCE